MAKKSGYLQKQALIQRVYIEAAEAVMKQFMVDTLQIAINDEFGFGPERLERLVKKWGEVYSKYYPCLNASSSSEADYQREKLDEELRGLLPEGFDWLDFETRYPDLKRIKY